MARQRTPSAFEAQILQERNMQPAPRWGKTCSYEMALFSLRFEFIAVDDLAHLLEHKRAVHQKQPLLRNDRFVTLSHRSRRIGKIERVEFFVQVASVDVTV